MADEIKPSIELGSRSSDDADPLLHPSEVEELVPPLRWQRTRSDRATRFKQCLRSSISCVLIIVITCALWVTAYEYSKHKFWRYPTSHFYREKHVFDPQYSTEREALARKFVAKWNSTVAHGRPNRDPTLCVGIVTVKRKHGINYFNGTVGSMLGSLTDEERSFLNVQVLFSDLDPANHPDWQSPWLNSLDFYSDYQLPESKKKEIGSWRNLQTKGIFDYVYMIDQCLNSTNAAYIAVFEDDLIFAEGWLAKTIDALRQIRQRAETNWLYLRLFYVDRYGKYKMHGKHYLYIALGSTFGATLVSACLWKFVFRKNHVSILLTVGLFSLPAGIFLCYLIGKEALFPQDGLQIMNHACCSQALIYPREKAMEVAEMLRPKTRGQTDLEIEKWATSMEFTRFASRPQLAQHVGSVSSRGLPAKIATVARSHFFEGYVAERLRAAHMKLLEMGSIWRATSKQGMN